MRTLVGLARWGAVAAIVVTHAFAGVADAQDAGDAWPRRVLITNDNGIEDPKIHALALAMSRIAETYVAAPAEDESGTGSSMSLFRDGSLAVKEVEVAGAAGAWAVDGYPADCVVWALLGPLRDTPPDLVLSGVNGGANIGREWFGSGTVGAARTAAFLGLPAVAISGLDDSDTDQVEKTMKWVVELAQSGVVRSLDDGRYLTVSIPPAGHIRGVKVVPRDKGVMEIDLDEADPGEDGWTTWRITGLRPGAPDAGGDIEAFLDGWIVVIPMRAHESDVNAIQRLQQAPEAIPAWPAP